MERTSHVPLVISHGRWRHRWPRAGPAMRWSMLFFASRRCQVLAVVGRRGPELLRGGADIGIDLLAAQ